MEFQPVQMQITVMGETNLHTLAVITPSHDTHFGMSVGDVINLVAGRHGFNNLHQLALKTPGGVELKRGSFLEFKLSPIVHLFTLKGRAEQELNIQQIRVFRYSDGGPCVKVSLQSDMIDMSELLIEACVHFDLEISKYELVTIEHQVCDFYVRFKMEQVEQVRSWDDKPTYEFEKFNVK